jgi:hypothetical protein
MNRNAEEISTPETRHGVAVDRLQPKTECASNALTPIVERLVATLRQETDALTRDGDMARNDFISEKSKLMLALIQAQASLDPRNLPPSAIDDLKRLKAALAANASYLGRHIEAVSGIARTLERIVDSSTSDGTYSRHDF